jgi:hypothetical protein
MPLVTAGLTIEIEEQNTAIDWLVDRIAPGTSTSGGEL